MQKKELRKIFSGNSFLVHKTGSTFGENVLSILEFFNEKGLIKHFSIIELYANPFSSNDKHSLDDVSPT